MQRFSTSPFIIRLRLLLSLFALASLVAACATDVDDEGDDEEVAEETAQELVAGAGRRVCSWNIRRLGNNFENQPKDFAATAKVIRDNCDLVAIEETMVTISQSGTDHGGYDALLDTLGRRYWDGTISETPIPNPVTSNSEYYAFVFRKSAVSTCPGSRVQRLPDPEDVFIREPAWACFKLKTHPRELVVAAYHALFGSPVDRKREVSFLDDDLDRNGKPDDLFAAMKASRKGNPDVLLLGDFNLNARELSEALPRYVDLTKGNGSTINSSNQITANQYDHAVVPADSPLLAKTAPAEVLDVRKVAKGDTYFTSVSDHLPIRLILK